MQARLKVLHDKANVKQVKLLPVTLIGRSTECNLKIASSQVSRAHCRITLGEDTVYIEDLGSANGTLIDGKRLVAHQPTPVMPGATLVVGPAEFLIDYVASTSATMVLSRLSAPISPSLSSTELLLPTKGMSVGKGDSTRAATAPPMAAALPVVAPKANPTAIPVVAALVAQAVPAAAPVAAVVATMPVVAKVTATPAAFTPAPVAVPEAAPIEMAFTGFASSDDEPVIDEASQFMFGESTSSEDSPASFADPQSKSISGKKGGLKSLFSLFGRKPKGTTEPTEPAASSNAPSVFLPTMDQIEASLTETDAEPSRFSFGDPATVESTSQTVTFEPPESAAAALPAEAPAADEEDGFQQFLKQL